MYSNNKTDIEFRRRPSSWRWSSRRRSGGGRRLVVRKTLTTTTGLVVQQSRAYLSATYFFLFFFCCAFVVALISTTYRFVAVCRHTHARARAYTGVRVKRGRVRFPRFFTRSDDDSCSSGRYDHQTIALLVRLVFFRFPRRYLYIVLGIELLCRVQGIPLLIFTDSARPPFPSFRQMRTRGL